MLTAFYNIFICNHQRVPELSISNKSTPYTPSLLMFNHVDILKDSCLILLNVHIVTLAYTTVKTEPSASSL